MDINKIINQKVKEFEENLSVKAESEKNLVHYNSVINITRRILFYEDKRTNLLKEKLISYFDEIESCNYVVSSKLESSILHNTYILPIEQFLIKKEQFVTNSDIHLFVVLGIIIDLILYFITSVYYYPIFILLLFILGVYRRKQAIKNGKYAKMFW